MEKQLETTPQIGDKKTYRKFAFAPVLVGDEKVWLTDYEETIEYKQTYKRITIMGGVTQMVKDECKWIVVARRKLTSKAATA